MENWKDPEFEAMNVSEPFIRRPVGTSLLAAGVLLLGAVAYHFLPVAPLPKVDFPTIFGERAGARRRSRNGCIVAGRSARATLRTNRRRFGNYFGQFVRRIVHHDSIRSQPGYQWRRARRPKRDRCRFRRIAQRPAPTAFVPQSESVRRADHGPGHDFRYPAVVAKFTIWPIKSLASASASWTASVR